MSSFSDWQVSPALQPKLEDYTYDLDTVLSAVVGLRMTVPEDAFTAQTLGTERAGNGVLIRDGVILTSQVRTISLRRIGSPPVGVVQDRAIRRSVRGALAHHLGLDIPGVAD